MGKKVAVREEITRCKKGKRFVTCLNLATDEEFDLPTPATRIVVEKHFWWVYKTLVEMKSNFCNRS